MKTTFRSAPLEFSEDGNTVRVSHNNRGEPFRDGIELSFHSETYGDCYVLLEDRETKLLRDKLTEYLNNL